MVSLILISINATQRNVNNLNFSVYYSIFFNLYYVYSLGIYLLNGLLSLIRYYYILIFQNSYIYKYLKSVISIFIIFKIKNAFYKKFIFWRFHYENFKKL